MQLALAAPGNASAGTVEVSDLAFAKEYNEDLVYQVVNAYMASCLLYTSDAADDP